MSDNTSWWRDIGAVLVLSLIFWPWAVLLIDLAAWMIVDATITGIIYTDLRFLVFAIWPVAWCAVVLMMCA